MSRASSRFQSTNRSSGQALSSSEELGQSADRVRGISEQVSKLTGLSTSQVADIGFRLSVGVGMPGISPVKVDASGSTGKAY